MRRSQRAAGRPPGPSGPAASVRFVEEMSCRRATHETVLNERNRLDVSHPQARTTGVQVGLKVACALSFPVTERMTELVGSKGPTGKRADGRTLTLCLPAGDLHE